MAFPFIKQYDSMDCGPTCLAIVSKYYGKNFRVESLRQKTQIGKAGVNLLGISEAAEIIGFKSRGIKISFKELIEDAEKPAILHWKQNHFVVLTPKASRNQITIADPAKGIITYNKKQFLKGLVANCNPSSMIGFRSDSRLKSLNDLFYCGHGNCRASRYNLHGL